MNNKKIYTKRPLQYQELKSIARELLQLVACVAGLIAFNYALELLAHWLV